MVARPRIVSDEEILDAARRVFLQHGPTVATKVIADAVGLSQPALFKRFGTKERLMLESLLPSGEPPFLHMLRSGPEPRDVRTQLVEIGCELSSFFDRMLPCLMTLRATGDTSIEHLFAEMDNPPPLQAKVAMSEWFDRAHQMGLLYVEDAEAMALAFLGSLQSGAFLAHITRTTRDQDDIRRRVTSLVSTLYRGMTP